MTVSGCALTSEELSFGKEMCELAPLFETNGWFVFFNMANCIELLSIPVINIKLPVFGSYVAWLSSIFLNFGEGATYDGKEVITLEVLVGTC